jgi:protein SCO1/2
MKIPKWALVTTVLFILAGAVTGGALWWLTARHAFAGLVQEPAAAAPDFSLVDETGQAFALSDLRGQWVLLAYGYTHCPDVCPATLNNLKNVKQALGPQADEVRVVFVSVDPERDTVDILKPYVHHFGADFKGLTGTPEAVAVAAQQYGVIYVKKESDSAAGYLVGHSAYTYLIDPEFRWRITYPFGVQPDDIAADIEYLMTHPLTGTE